MGPSDKFLGLRGSADGLLGLGLMSTIKTPLTTPTNNALEMAVRTGAGAGRALPAGVHEYYEQAATAYGIFTVGKDSAYGNAVVLNNTDGAGNATLAGETRLDGLCYVGGGNGEMKIQCPNGNYTLHLALSRFSSQGNWGFQVYNLAKTTLLVPGVVSAAGVQGSAMDAMGSVYTAATFFGNEAGRSITVTDGGLVIFGNGDAGTFNWFKVVPA